MAAPFNIPADLKREAFWFAVANERFSTLLDELTRAGHEGAAEVLVRDLCDLVRLPPDAKPEQLERLLEATTVKAWVERWTPLPKLTGRGRIDSLRHALAAIGQVYRTRTARPDLGPVGAMTLETLSARVGPDSGVWIPRAMGTVDSYLRSLYVDQAFNALVQRLASELQTSLLAARTPNAEAFAAWRAAAQGSPAIAGLLTVRAALAPAVLPTTPELRSQANVSWDRGADVVHAQLTHPLACLTGRCTRATIDLHHEPPIVMCRERGPCRGKLLAVEALLDELAQPTTPTSQALRAHMERPVWSRMLARVAHLGEPTRHEPIAWLYKEKKRELTPAKVSRTAKGTIKATAVARSHWDALEPEQPSDIAALTSLASRGMYEDDDERAAKALFALIGRDNVYARIDNDTIHVRVMRLEPRLVPREHDGGVRLEVRLGDTALALAEAPRAGTWQVVVDVAHGVLHVGVWTAHMARSAAAISDVIVPSEGRMELVDALLAARRTMAVTIAPELLGERYAPLDDVVFRLGLDGPRGARQLVVEGRVKPVPELGALAPGEGEAIIPVRRDGKVGHVARDLEAEQRLVAEHARAVGLDPHAHAWTIDGLEPALALSTALEERGVPLEWRTTRPTIQRKRNADALRLSLGMKRDWLDLRGAMALDGGELPLAELLAALRDKKRYVELDGDRFVELGDTLALELQPLVALARQGRDGALGTSLFAAPLMRELAEAGVVIEGPEAWLAKSQSLDEAARLEVVMPSDLAAELRPYQVDGVTWLARLAHWATGACLADDMGLGKTLQALAFLLLRRGGTALVVAPTSVVTNWLREADRFAPTLSVVAVRKGADLSRLDDAPDVVVTSWDLLVRHIERFKTTLWATIVFDEAHAMKNAVTRRAQAARELDAGFVLTLTGTPVENRPAELWSLFQVVAPGLLGSAESFREHWARPIESGDREASRRLGRLVRPFLLRRKKSEVASDLPSRTEVQVDVVLSSDERERYERVRRSALSELQKLDPSLTAGQAHLRILVVLTRLRQLACHPRLVDPKAGPSSAKLERLLELVSELRDEGRKVLVFSQFTELLGLARAAFEAAGITYTYLDGQTPAEQRPLIIDRFQRGATDAFLLSLKAGGVGLNLTAATEVIHLDPWWNPAAEDQATDRAHRIGQHKPVTVYRLVAQGTIEEQIVALHGDKRRMVASLLEGTGSSAPLSAAELMALLSEEGLQAAAPEDGAAS